MIDRLIGRHKWDITNGVWSQIPGSISRDHVKEVMFDFYVMSVWLLVSTGKVMIHKKSPYRKAVLFQAQVSPY